MIGEDGEDRRFETRPERPIRSHWDGLRIMTWAVGVALVVALLLLLTACNGGGHKGEHCVRSHEETRFVPVGGGYCGNGCYHPPVMVPMSEKHCDQWAPDDPATAVKP